MSPFSQLEKQVDPTPEGWAGGKGQETREGRLGSETTFPRSGGVGLAGFKGPRVTGDAAGWLGEPPAGGRCWAPLGPGPSPACGIQDARQTVLILLPTRGLGAQLPQNPLSPQIPEQAEERRGIRLPQVGKGRPRAGSPAIQPPRTGSSSGENSRSPRWAGEEI